MCSKFPSAKAKMLAFLPWVIKPMNLYKIFSPDNSDDGISTATLLIECDAMGEYSGNFRWALTGEDPLTANFPASDVFGFAAADEFHLSWETRADDIILRENGSSSEWFDLEELLSASRMFASRGDDDDTHDFIGK